MIYWKIWWKFGLTLQIQISSSKAPLMEFINLLKYVWSISKLLQASVSKRVCDMEKTRVSL